jgi:SHS2 domain-containing protein
LTPHPGRPHWEELDHTADVGVRAFGDTLEQLFTHAAEGMFRIIAGERTVRPLQERSVTVAPVPAGEEPDRLLVRFLSELLFLCETERFLFGAFEVDLSGGGVRAVCRGEEIGPDRSGLGMEIKAVTWHGLSLDLERGEAQVIFDV